MARRQITTYRYRVVIGVYRVVEMNFRTGKLRFQVKRGKHCSWIHEAQHLPLEPNIYISAIFGDIPRDIGTIWRKIQTQKSPTSNASPIVFFGRNINLQHACWLTKLRNSHSPSHNWDIHKSGPVESAMPFNLNNFRELRL